MWLRSWLLKQKNQSNGNYETILAVNFLCLLKTKAEKWRDEYIVGSPNLKVGRTSLPRSLRLLRLCTVQTRRQIVALDGSTFKRRSC